MDEADAGDAAIYSDWGVNIFSDEETDTTLTSNSKSAKSDRESSMGDVDSEELRQLLLMFPEAKRFNLEFSLKKCRGDVDKAIDELLNQAFLEGEGEGGRGVEGFSEDAMITSRRKGKRRGKGTKIGSIWEEIDDAPNNNGVAPSKWEQMQSEISYLSSKLNVPLPATTSTYHKHGTLSATLVALVELYGDGDNMPQDDFSHVENITIITSKYPKLQLSHVIGLVKLCKDDVASAFKFAELLHLAQLNKISIKSPTSPPLSPLSPVSPAVPSNNIWKTAGKKMSSTSPTSPRSPASPTSPVRPTINYRSAAIAAGEHFQARSEAYDKASTYYRRSKSDHLMGAAAIYYADQGKEHGAKLKKYSDMAAEALVSENSGEYTLDLHGVTVQQALKIANERVTDWWVKTTSTDSRAVTPFHIITGMGTHSKGGVSKLGPAVSKMLLKGNWKIEVSNGHIIVRGVQKRMAAR